jgi:hypothetical protein
VITEPAQVRLSLLATGQFVSIFSNAILKFSAQRHQLKVLPVKQILKQVPVGILTLKNRTPSPLTKLFVAESHQVAKGLVENELCAM